MDAFETVGKHFGSSLDRNPSPYSQRENSKAEHNDDHQAKDIQGFAFR